MNSDGYIKMVLALPESFFDGWQWKEGDALLIKPLDEEWVIKHVGSRQPDEPDGWTDGYDFNNIPDDYLSFIRPLPSQKQLQDRVMRKHICSPFELSQLFFEWLSWERFKAPSDSDYVSVSLDCRWLEYTAYYELSIRWNGVKWIGEGA